MVLFGRSWQGNVATRIRVTGGYCSQFQAVVFTASPLLACCTFAFADSSEQPANKTAPSVRMMREAGFIKSCFWKSGFLVAPGVFIDKPKERIQLRDVAF